jgi:hypothetical protein
VVEAIARAPGAEEQAVREIVASMAVGLRR